ncbi:unnamed protein product [Rotaria socialis]|nr:unnamed protein product [Rotaria socialis]CAF3416690.1 unnamed protein product [Rotaria socialis]
MIDTGATHSFITQGAFSTLYHSAIPPCDRIAQLGDGQTLLKIVGEVQLLSQFDKVFTRLNVLVVKTMNTDFLYLVVIGVQVMQHESIIKKIKCLYAHQMAVYLFHITNALIL